MASSVIKGGTEDVTITWESGYEDGGGTKIFVKDGIMYANLSIYKPAGSLPTSMTIVATLSKNPKDTIVMGGAESNAAWVPTGNSIVHIGSNGQVKLASTGTSSGKIACVNGTGKA